MRERGRGRGREREGKGEREGEGGRGGEKMRKKGGEGEGEEREGKGNGREGERKKVQAPEKCSEISPTSTTSSDLFRGHFQGTSTKKFTGVHSVIKNLDPCDFYTHVKMFSTRT